MRARESRSSPIPKVSAWETAAWNKTAASTLCPWLSADLPEVRSCWSLSADTDGFSSAAPFCFADETGPRTLLCAGASEPTTVKGMTSHAAALRIGLRWYIIHLSRTARVTVQARPIDNLSRRRWINGLRPQVTGPDQPK